MSFLLRSGILALSCSLAGGCASIFPDVGPGRVAISRAPAQREVPLIHLVDVNAEITRRLRERQASARFSEAFRGPGYRLQPIGTGDVLTVSVWEAAPATLFGPIKSGAQDVLEPSLPTTLPPQPVDGDGCITVPFAGRVPAAGRTLPEIEADIRQRIAAKANLPEVLVLLTKNRSAMVTIVGDVTTNTRMELTEAHERLLDAIAYAQGVHQPVTKTVIQLTRGGRTASMPLGAIISDPSQNVILEPGDVVTALYKTLSFSALGATGKNDEVPFEASGISLAQALARSQGLNDQRSNARGVFVFRYETRNAPSGGAPAGPAPGDDRLPVVYRFDLADPRTLFLIQEFPILDQDVLYVSNAPIGDVQKFLNLLFLVAYPVATVHDVGLF